MWLFDTSTLVPRKRISGGGVCVGGKSAGSIFNLRPFAESLPPLLSPVLGNEILPALIHWDGIMVHKGKFPLVTVEVFYKKKFDVLCENNGRWQLLVSFFDMCQLM